MPGLSDIGGVRVTVLADPPRRETKHQSITLPGQDPRGGYVLSVLVKRTYDIGPDGTCRRAEVDRKLIPGDVHFGDPMNSSVRFESDFVPWKVATDVVLNGTAHAPRGEPTRELLASLTVGTQRKSVVVVGDRVCRYRARQPPLFNEPTPFTELPIRYERAFGGVDIATDPDVPCAYARNPLGRGFVIGSTRKALEGLELPNIEDPADRITPERLCVGHFIYWERQPMPQGFGWFSKYWRPRALFAGVMPADRAAEQELRRAYAAVVPPEQRDLYEQTALPDMDFRFFNGASPGLALPYLEGDEPVRAINLTPDGERQFRLPGERPEIALDLGLPPESPDVVLQTVMIRLDERQVDLVWRAAFPYPGPDWLPQMRRMEVTIQ